MLSRNISCIVLRAYPDDDPCFPQLHGIGGQPMDKVVKDTDRDLFLSPEQAVEYGIIDEVYKQPAIVPPKGK